VSEFSQMLIERSGYEAEGFAHVYDRYRPSPPPELLEILAVVAQVDRPRLVVDLGAGTDFSTRVWAERAEEVIGVEANARMVERGRLATPAPNVGYVEAFTAETGLDEASADFVTCAQAFHWMESAPVLAEAARILRRGGVFAAYDYDVPPVSTPRSTQSSPNTSRHGARPEGGWACRRGRPLGRRSAT
jgi:SAM-dependent methyltransferase